jgi:hypothetical protein
MRKVTQKVAFLAALLLAASLHGVAQAQVVSEPVQGFFGIVEGSSVFDNGQGPMTDAVTVVYTNTSSAANFGFSSTDLAADWGDRLLLVGTGVLSEHVFSVFNTGTSAGNLLTAAVAVDFFDTGSSAFLGGYTTNVSFGAGLPPGFYSLVTVTALDGLAINIPNPDIIVVQTLLGTTGPANRLGIASLDPPTVGSSPITMYINASTVGPAGFYNIGNPPLPANPGYHVAVTAPSTDVTTQSWGRIKKMYR